MMALILFKYIKMSQSNNHINYIELYTNNLESIKTFYTKVFGWTFTDYGPNYTAFSDSGLAGGFEKTEQPITNGALIVIYHNNLEVIKKQITDYGCTISVDIFSFPGGRRFQFIDPSGNELAIWTEV
jgi:predicted enzyme related to lactoylglutathione lyase